ncbi:MAG: hypothetical protein ACR2PI_20660 [Hyphomicrobiaceae bacterium]
MMELGAIYLALFVIDFLFFPRFGEFFTLSPHPFWLPVLLFSLQYGFSRAVVTAITAIAISWLFLTPEQVLGEPYFDYVARSSVTPAMWLGAALIVGEMRQRQIAERAQVGEELIRLRAQAEILSKHCADTKQANLDLQLKIAAGKTAPIEHALIQLGSRQSQDIQQFLASFEDALTSLVGDHKASVFVINEEQGLDLAFQFGWTASDHFRHDFQPDHPLCRAVIGRSQIVSSHRSAWDNDVLQGEGEVAVPIQYIYHGGAYGMLKVEAAGANTESDERLGALVLLGREMGIFLEQSALEKGGTKTDREDQATPLRAAG